MIRKSNVITTSSSNKNEINLQKARDQIDGEIRKQYNKCCFDEIVIDLRWLNSDQLADQLKQEYQDPNYGEWKVRIDSGLSRSEDDIGWCNLILS